MALTARALYDFEGDPDNGELSFRGGDILTIVAQDIGEGWWEAKNDLGHQGLIPEAYVEAISTPVSSDLPEPSFPPPPPPMQGGDNFTQSYVSEQQNNQYYYNGVETTNTNSHAGYTQKQQSVEGWDDDDWDDDDDHSSTSTGDGTSRTGHTQELQGGGNFGLAPAKRESKQLSPGSDMSKYGTVKKSFNRFSQFAKAGGEAFMMGQFQGSVPDNDQIPIVDSANGPIWQPNPNPYTCEVKSPKKESKLKGLKSFIAYQLTPSFSNLQVSRRYKHFDWLHERLEEKFACIPVPPLPEKAISGRYEDDFITERMHQLQLWMDRMTRHPVISKSDVFIHFLSCTDEKKWKIGKRKAEKDEYLGSKFFLLLKTPSTPLDMRDVDKRMETFVKFVKGMDDNVRGSIAVMLDNKKKHLGPFKREYQKIGGSFKSLAATFNLDKSDFSQGLTAAVDYTGDTYNEIGEMFNRQPKNDLEPAIDVLHEYKGILSVFPDVLKLHEGAVGRAKECLKEKDEGKMTESQVQGVVEKADIITYGTLAEISHFQEERVHDFKKMMTEYLQGQIQFYRNITEKLEATLQRFDQA